MPFMIVAGDTKMGPIASRAHWIALGSGEAGFPLLRREWEWDGRGPVRIWVNVLGYYELHVNGEHVGARALDPPVSNYSRRSFAVPYDITAHLHAGVNCIGFWLGRGWYQASGPDARFPYPGVFHDGPVVRAWCTATGDERPFLVTDTDWRAAPSSITQLGSWFYSDFGGERYDARLEQSGWAQPGFHDEDWQAANTVTVPSHETSIPEAPRNRVLEEVAPVAMERFSDAEGGGWQVDFGRTITGWVRLRLRGQYEPGDAVRLEYTDGLAYEQFDPFGQVDEYLCRGGEAESFTSRFNYHTFRWVRIRGLPGDPAPEGIRGLFLTADMPRTGRFDCDNKLLNRIHELQVRTLRCLTLNGVQVDCPHRERLGYGGDGTASLKSTLYLFEADALYRHWLLLWRDELRPDGGWTHTAPCPFGAGGGPVWCGFPLTAAWNHYLHVGDSALLTDQYPAMLTWFDYVHRHMQDGLLRRWPDTDYREWYLGDWLPPEGVDATHAESIDLVNNCFLVQCYDRMHAIARILGRPEEAVEHAHRATALRSAIHGAFYHAGERVYADGDQVDLAYPLLARIVPEGMRPEVLARLEKEIRRSGRARIGTGLVGTFVLIDLLVEEGRNDLLYEMIATREYPGWGYMLEHGATAGWEAWDRKTPSRTHNTFNSVGAWFYTALAGIHPDAAAPGFRRVRIQPQPVRELARVEASHDSAAGRIAVRWDWREDDFTLYVTVPEGTTAEVHVPTSDSDSVTAPASARRAGNNQIGIYGYAVFTTTGGEHCFRARLFTLPLSP